MYSNFNNCERTSYANKPKWYCKFETDLPSAIYKLAQCVSEFLHTRWVCVASASPALKMHDHSINLRIELASVVDGFLPIVQAYQDCVFVFHTRGDLKEAVDFFKVLASSVQCPRCTKKFMFLNDDEKKQLVSEATAYRH